MKRHVGKKPPAVIHARAGLIHLRTARESLLKAQTEMAQSGWSGAFNGICAIDVRVDSWLNKISAELAGIDRGEL